MGGLWHCFNHIIGWLMTFKKITWNWKHEDWQMAKAISLVRFPIAPLHQWRLPFFGAYANVHKRGSQFLGSNQIFQYSVPKGNPDLVLFIFWGYRWAAFKCIYIYIHNRRKGWGWIRRWTKGLQGGGGFPWNMAFFRNCRVQRFNCWFTNMASLYFVMKSGFNCEN